MLVMSCGGGSSTAAQATCSMHVMAGCVRAPAQLCAARRHLHGSLRCQAGSQAALTMFVTQHIHRMILQRHARAQRNTVAAAADERSSAAPTGTQQAGIGSHRLPSPEMHAMLVVLLRAGGYRRGWQTAVTTRRPGGAGCLL